MRAWRSKMFCMPVYLSSVYEGDIITRVAWLALYVPDSYELPLLTTDTILLNQVASNARVLLIVLNAKRKFEILFESS